MTEKEKILKKINYNLNAPHAEAAYNFNILIDQIFDFIRNAGLYDFYVNSGAGWYELYFRLYNSSGRFFGSKLWGIYNDQKEILKICRNIIANKIK